MSDQINLPTLYDANMAIKVEPVQESITKLVTMAETVRAHVEQNISRTDEATRISDQLVAVTAARYHFPEMTRRALFDLVTKEVQREIMIGTVKERDELRSIRARHLNLTEKIVSVSGGEDVLIGLSKNEARDLFQGGTGDVDSLVDSDDLAALIRSEYVVEHKISYVISQEIEAFDEDEAEAIANANLEDRAASYIDADYPDDVELVDIYEN